ncbi:MAG: hypothetical protein BWY10_00719 [Chloroflexi bacterium ADurb.Bin180]|nr:MAG: hypothetical protein BWY10_00719 [Chloroflexi bacterium ADurb.Bin180]HQJ51689.1 hypothetical protein [Anaerolineae bacterium]
MTATDDESKNTELNITSAESERLALLSRRVNELRLRIPGTRLEVLINQLYDELARAGIQFRPRVYLSDEWGCPDRVPVIGIPFYLADPVLSQMEGELTEVEAEGEAEVLMYLRHETGHAFNYAYRLYLDPEWKRLFGSISDAYEDDYKTIPFSARYVRHVPGWYGQRHPDDDFAETFAVWLYPGSDWRRRYAGTVALTKLQYVDRVAHQLGGTPPVVSDGALDVPVEEMDITLAEWYAPDEEGPACSLPAILDSDLESLFPAVEGQPAHELIHTWRRSLVRDLHHWTGVTRPVLHRLLAEVDRHLKKLNLKVESDQVPSRLEALAIFLTTLVMNYNYTGQFVDR